MKDKSSFPYDASFIICSSYLTMSLLEKFEDTNGGIQSRRAKDKQFKDTNGGIKSRRAKDKQFNCPRKKNKGQTLVDTNTNTEN